MVYYLAMGFMKKNITLVIGVSIPILMILFVAGSIYLPGLFVQPKYNFLYVVDDNYYTQQQYSVQNNRLIKSEFVQPESKNPRPVPASRLYLYDMEKNESQEIPFENAQLLNLDSRAQSPDGFEVVQGNRNGGDLFFIFGSGSDYNTRYLKGNGVSKKLNLDLNRNGYYNFRFLGWVQ